MIGQLECGVSFVPSFTIPSFYIRYMFTYPCNIQISTLNFLEPIERIVSSLLSYTVWLLISEYSGNCSRRDPHFIRMGNAEASRMIIFFDREFTSLYLHPFGQRKS